MRAVLAGEAGEGLTHRVQAWVLRRMGDSMQIESLWRFNAKFDPDWQPRYAVYDAPENLLAVAIAVARAESFWELPVIGRFLVPSSPVARGRLGVSRPSKGREAGERNAGRPGHHTLWMKVRPPKGRHPPENDPPGPLVRPPTHAGPATTSLDKVRPPKGPPESDPPDPGPPPHHTLWRKLGPPKGRHPPESDPPHPGRRPAAARHPTVSPIARFRSSARPDADRPVLARYQMGSKRPTSRGPPEHPSPP